MGPTMIQMETRASRVRVAQMNERFMYQYVL